MQLEVIRVWQTTSCGQVVCRTESRTRPRPTGCLYIHFQRVRRFEELGDRPGDWAGMGVPPPGLKPRCRVQFTSSSYPTGLGAMVTGTRAQLEPRNPYQRPKAGIRTCAAHQQLAATRPRGSNCERLGTPKLLTPDYMYRYTRASLQAHPGSSPAA